MTVLRLQPLRRPDRDTFEAPAGSVRIANFDTSLSRETVEALAAVDANQRLAVIRARSIFVG